MSAAETVGTVRASSTPRDAAPSPRPIDPGRRRAETQTARAGVDHLSSGAIDEAGPTVGSPRSTPDAVGHAPCAQGHTPDADGYLALRAIAEVFEDVQKVRIAIENRVRSAPIDAELVEQRLQGLHESEHQLALLLRRTFRKNVEAEIVGWQAATVGIGEHMLARLLGVIGHPVYTTRHAWEGEGDDRVLVVVGQMERRVSDLWSYCGHGDPNRRKKKGMNADEAMAIGSPRAKMLVHLLAESCLKHKARSPYGPIYDFARAKYEVREGWTPLHQHNAALRLVGKEILRDLWMVAR